MENPSKDDPIPDHKLCGYLRTVVTIPPPQNSQTLPPLNARCHISVDGPDGVHFVSNNGVVLSPVSSSLALAENGETSNGRTPAGSKKKWSRRIGMVRGSLSVVHQLHALVMKKCLTIAARVIGVSMRGDEVRVVLLVDVYLPIALWSGWQFPRSATTAAALFKHLSCDWKTRLLMLASSRHDLADDCGTWNLPDCHVLECKQQCSVAEASKRKLFELHEIFRSLPSVMKGGNPNFSKVNPANTASETGIWLVPDDILIKILTALRPIDLVRVAATCLHLRSLAAPIMPCMKLKLFPHQQAAVEWMLQRERHSEVLQHPLYLNFTTQDGFPFYVNTVSGKIVTGMVPAIKDFRGGMFCDEPGLGKTITALSLILKTQGRIADPPDGVQVIWCDDNSDQKRGYYEIKDQSTGSNTVSLNNRVTGHNPRRGQFCQDDLTPTKNSKMCTLKDGIVVLSDQQVDLKGSCPEKGIVSQKVTSGSLRTRTCSVHAARSCGKTKRNLLNEYEEASVFPTETVTRNSAAKRKQAPDDPRKSSLEHSAFSDLSSCKGKRPKMMYADHFQFNETWVQCDGCGKWRKLLDASAADTSRAWFCSMNSDPLYQNCGVPEETWNYESITYLPGFCTKGTPGGLKENVSFFTSVLREHHERLNYRTKKVLTWLAKLPPEKLSEMETGGLAHPVAELCITDDGNYQEYHHIFQAFGLVKSIEKHVTRWYYPRNLANLVFDLDALRVALCEPLGSLRIYVSRATLIVVPSNLVDHWKTQIEEHVRPGQLRVYAWTDHKKPSPHYLAWDFDVVITTFSRLSTEWSRRKRSALMQVHWLRVILDEGHTLGSSLSLTNKLQMAVFLRASSRWLLTGTPTPNTPNSQLSHLKPMLKFLHEEAYGLNQKSWEDGILRPFEAEMEDGRMRLLQLLHRCMISARKIDLKTIPPCIKKVAFLDFNDEHARSYNELVETVRRNILLADWNDPSHVESLLNPKQWKFRSVTIRNLRLSCCVAGHIRVTDAGQDIQEAMDVLKENGLDPVSEEFDLLKSNLLHGGNCMRCKEWCRLPVITPCRHLLCIDCVALDSERCTLSGCGNLYEMQSPETLARPENPNPMWPDDWHPDWQLTSSSKVSYLVSRLKMLLQANQAIDNSNDEKGVHLHFSLQRCSQQDVLELKGQLTRTIPEKVIVFSQFLEHIHVIEQQLTIAGIQFAGMYNPMPSASKMKSLATFQNDANCVALLMDGSAALGLDLSFVTHVYLMEPIWDKSVEEQVISRAHRMGATRPIYVETLAMNGTIEEQMLNFLQDADECKRLLKEEFGKHDGAGARVYRTLHDFAENNYLAQLNFVRRNSRT
ncbi:unnamed protein product [Coffea canephora]|uniref:DH200=94 genomic scaffold, scaffold_260 n=1 Tax=Coffea canephora TaxID=49390 RepID=A0A068VD13_COFCA|nr:unnamed protein product [Coffea canephora]